MDSCQLVGKYSKPALAGNARNSGDAGVKIAVAGLTGVESAISRLDSPALDDGLLIPPGYVAHAPAPALPGASEAAIAETTGHQSLDMVRRYTRKADRFRRGVSGKVGL